MRKIVLFICLFFVGNFAFSADFSVFRLNNGQTVVIQEIHSNPIVTIDTWVKTGSINETDKNSGISHFLEHLFFKGTEKHPYGDFDKILEAKGAVNNAATSKDFTHYYVTIPSEHFDLALELHADMLQNPAIPQEEMDKERLVVLEEIAKDKNNPQNIVYNNLMEMMYINHPYKKPVIGRAKVVENISRDEILEYFNRYYAPSNMVTIIAGDVDTKTALNKVKTHFSKDYRKTPCLKYPKEKQLPSLLRKVEKSNAESGYILIGFRGVNITDKDSYALDVLSTILGEGKTSFLYKNLKDKKQIVFSVGASNSTAKDDGILYISANFVPEKYEEVESAIFEEISNLQQTGVTKEQVKLAQNIIERDTYYSRESVSNIAQELGYTIVTAGDTDFYKNYVANIKKVSQADVNRVLNKYLGENKAAISVLLPENYDKSKVTKSVSKEVTSKLVSKNSETQKYELSNGAIVLLTPNYTNDIIAISISANGGEFLEHTPGTGKLTAGLMMKGTKNYSSDQLAEILENNGIKIAPTSGCDRFSITVMTTKPQLEKTLDMLDEIVNNAVLSEVELRKLKSDNINSIKKNRDVALKRAVEEYNTLIYQGSVYSNSTKILENTYPKVSQEEIASYYNNIFNPNNLIISVNGNIDSDRILKRFGKIFNKPRGEKFDYSKYKIPSIASPRISKQIDKNTQTDWVFLAWQVPGCVDKKEYATLLVMDTILGSGMSSRMFVNLREREGLAYQLGSNYNAHMLKGSFVTYIGTNPKTLSKSVKKMFEEIDKLKMEYVTSDELQAAKDKLIGYYILSQETNLAKAMQLDMFESSGYGYEFKQKYIDMVKSVSAKDIYDVANKYFGVNNYVMSVVKK